VQNNALQGKGAVITGGGRGIGAAVARALAAAGADVIVAARSRDEIEAVADALQAEGRTAAAVPVDVTDPDQARELARKANETLGQVDILVNSAGGSSSAPLPRIELAEWNRLFAVNATGAFLCTQAMLPAMAERGWGRVINVASVAGKIGGAYLGAYAASKHAVIGLTRAVAAEYARRGVTVNAVCPGFVETAMVERSIATIHEKTGRDEAEARRILEQQSPQGRIFSPDEVAYLVVSLCDPLASGINGQAIVLDGGGVQS
jgi:NAD(P)-dependent dehydrogenase (short-subunit alcohol dehydrogenase family)